ncbi:hypothetical protein [Cupriavidus sp. CuC1]|uniref:hypothetical protein n=1 Tax=Cupriavidus sp. CuC1 TaxID=3373131 RepID=UPI0037D0FFD7
MRIEGLSTEVILKLGEAINRAGDWREIAAKAAHIKTLPHGSPDRAAQALQLVESFDAGTAIEQIDEDIAAMHNSLAAVRAQQRAIRRRK